MSDNNNDHKESGSEEEEFEVVDLTENPMYQVLSQLFENEKGENVVDMLSKLVIAVQENTKMMKEMLASKST